MEEALKSGVMEATTMVTLLTVLSKAMVFTSGQMALSTVENGNTMR